MADDYSLHHFQIQNVFFLINLFSQKRTILLPLPFVPFSVTGFERLLSLERFEAGFSLKGHIDQTERERERERARERERKREREREGK